ncbi:MAG: carbohydrate ABC transporter permease, partial [Lachnospiraceae bacterium]|nr:carbohydrate ABC transporter permease [Lachnospiraceae bacterium]
MGINAKTKVFHCVLLVIIALAFVLPLIWLVVASLDTNASQALKWPTQWTLGNYADVISNEGNRRGFGIGLEISLIESAIVTLVSLLAAYPLSRYNLCYKKQFMYVILFMT